MARLLNALSEARVQRGRGALATKKSWAEDIMSMIGNLIKWCFLV